MTPSRGGASLQVRKELRARYPRQAWPEDPVTAVAERRPGGAARKPHAGWSRRVRNLIARRKTRHGSGSG